MTNRRHFLKTTAAAIAALILPRSLFATKPDKTFWFIHVDSQDSWPITAPVQWSLDHAHQPVLERASEGLRKLTPADGDRIIRLVVRRCRLNLIDLHHGQVVVHHWGQQGRADLRPWFKAHQLARQEIKVVQRDRKKEVITTQTGDDFLYGDRLDADYPVDLFLKKWVSRFVKQLDDWEAAPCTWSGFAWEGVEDGRIPWAAMKSVWRRVAPLICLNCDTPTLLVNFGQPWTGMFNRSAKFVHVCGTCRRSFMDDSIKDVSGWMAANLDSEVWPDAEIVWGRRLNPEPK